MSDDKTLLVEDFIHSIASQLDRVQDALRLKAVNRPLTYALKDFALDLHVFADVGEDGHVRFRTAGANEQGASTVRLGFTTITRPMIEENTMSLQATQGATLDELGLAPQERQRLERLGVRTVNQLQRLQKSAGTSTVQRFAQVPIQRLRAALKRGKPRVDAVVAPRRPPAVKAPVVQPNMPAPRQVPIKPRPVAVPRKPAADVRRLRLQGQHLVGAGLEVRFDDEPVEVLAADDDAIEVSVPRAAGALELRWDDGEVEVFDVMADDEAELERDPWGDP